MEWKYWSYCLRCKIEKEASTRLPSGETIIDPDKLNELKIKYLLVDWSFTDDAGNKIPLKRTGDALDPDSLEKVLSLDPNILMAFLAELNTHLYLLKTEEKKLVSEMTRKRGIVGDIDISIFLVRSLLWKEYGITQEELDHMDPKVVDKLLIYHRTKRELEEQETMRRAKGK